MVSCGLKIDALEYDCYSLGYAQYTCCQKHESQSLANASQLPDGSEKSMDSRGSWVQKHAEDLNTTAFYMPYLPSLTANITC